MIQRNEPTVNFSVFDSVMNLNALNLISFWRDSKNINSWKKRQF
jgi:hypothetical protein